MTQRLGTFRLVALLGMAVPGVLNAQPIPKPGVITDVRATHVQGVTQVAVTVSGVIDIKSDRIENPPRVFVDFLNTVPSLLPRTGAASSRSTQVVPVNSILVKQVRIAENQKGITRLVFDLAREDVDYRTSVSKTDNKLIVELKLRPAASGLRNPLADPSSRTVPPVAARIVPRMEPRVEPPVELRVESVRRAPIAPPRPIPALQFRLLDPPSLPATVKLPRAEAAQMPYLAGGFVFRDWRVKAPPVTPVAKQAARIQSPAVAAARNSNGRQSLTRVLGLKVGRVVIDPGHGGHDAGSTGVTGLTEKELTLDVSKRLSALISERLGSEVVLTRTEDVYIAPEQRTVIANQSHADLFISIHANASHAHSATGVETYYLNFTSSPEALEVAARENASSERGVSDLGDLIKKIALKDKIDESREFAAKVQNSLFAGSTKAGNRTKDRGVRKAPFVVLIGAQMPSVLTEIGFLSNAKEEALLRKPEYRQKIAEAIYKGIAQYAATLSHFNIAANAIPDEN
jgi:N-acetylmuramoyl-L-alanine amidase